MQTDNRTFHDVVTEITDNAWVTTGTIPPLAQLEKHAEAVVYLEEVIKYLKWNGMKPRTNNCDVLQLIHNSL